MPKQFKVENEFASMTDEQIMQQIRQLDALVAAELGQACGARGNGTNG
jgi:hypothetical protein